MAFSGEPVRPSRIARSWSAGLVWVAAIGAGASVAVAAARAGGADVRWEGIAGGIVLAGIACGLGARWVPPRLGRGTVTALWLVFVIALFTAVLAITNPGQAMLVAAVMLLVLGGLAALTGATELLVAVIATAVLAVALEGARRLRTR